MAQRSGAVSRLEYLAAVGFSFVFAVAAAAGTLSRLAFRSGVEANLVVFGWALLTLFLFTVTLPPAWLLVRVCRRQAALDRPFSIVVYPKPPVMVGPRTTEGRALVAAMAFIASVVVLALPAEVAAGALSVPAVLWAPIAIANLGRLLSARIIECGERVTIRSLFSKRSDVLDVAYDDEHIRVRSAGRDEILRAWSTQLWSRRWEAFVANQRIQRYLSHEENDAAKSLYRVAVAPERKDTLDEIAAAEAESLLEEGRAARRMRPP